MTSTDMLLIYDHMT